MWRIAVCDGLAESGLQCLRLEAEVVEDPQLAALGEVDALVVRGRTQLTAERLGRGKPRLKVVGRAGVGVDNIDLDAARAHEVIVVNAPLSATASVAELALGLMLALARRIPQADAAVRRGEWPKAAFAGEELAGKTLGLIGVGRIGAALAERAAAVGMRVLGHDPLIPDEAIQKAGAQPVGFETVLSESDYLSLHVPLTDSTRHLIDDRAFGQMRPGARLISTARGGVVDEEALARALADGRLAGAALDVFSHEPPAGSPLLRDERVILTPHIGAQTLPAQARAARDIAEEVLAALAGRPLRWRVA